MSAAALDLLTRQIDDAAAAAAGTAYLSILDDRNVLDFWTLPEAVQASVVAIGCDVADEARDAFAEEITAEPEALARVWRYAAQRFQAEGDRLLLAASHGSGRA